MSFSKKTWKAGGTVLMINIGIPSKGRLKKSIIEIFKKKKNLI